MKYRIGFVAGLVAVLASAAVASSLLEDAGFNAREFAAEYFPEWHAGVESAAAMNAALSGLPGEECRAVTRKLAEAYENLRVFLKWPLVLDDDPFAYSFGGSKDDEMTRKRARFATERLTKRLALATERRDRWTWRSRNVCRAEHIREGR